MQRIGLALAALALVFQGCSKDDENPVQPPSNPTKVYLQRLVIYDVPWTDQSGDYWDISTGPDLFIDLTNSSGTVVMSSSTVNDVTPDTLPVEWGLIAPGYQPPYLAYSLTARIYDYDATGDDFIGSLTFNLLSLANTYGYNSAYTVVMGGITLGINVDWE